ncbi:MAG: response regulator transcription factor [Alphaproteobacteria bacterium]|nr:response regulator transcription factor [Alphaproteobacteria bacterium]
MKILVVEDDKRTLSFVTRGLSEAGHVADAVQDGTAGLKAARDGEYDVVILDRMLPGMSGLDILQQLRSEHVRTPILMLTAMSTVEDRVEGLESGADDYLVKPFAFSELLARVHAIARRPPTTDVPVKLAIADLELDLSSRKVTRDGKRIDLTPQEYKLLEYLMRRAGKTVTRTMIMEHLWAIDFDVRANIVDAHMSRLRAKIDKGFKCELLRTVRGVGYVIDDPG